MIDRATVNQIALAAFEQTFGTRPDSAELVAPDQIQVRLGGNALGGTLQVQADGALVVASGIGSVRLVEPNSVDPVPPHRCFRRRSRPGADGND